MDPNKSKAELLDRFKEDDGEIDDLSRIEESDLLQSPRFKRLQSSSPPRSSSSSPSKSAGSNDNNYTSIDMIPKLEYRMTNPLLRTPTKSKVPKAPLQPLNTRPSVSRFLPSSPTKTQHSKLPEMKVSLTPAQRMEKKSGRLLSTNDILSQYDFKETVGRGAFANVYRAINKNTEAEVAVKEILIEDDDDILELMSEIDLLKILRHKNVVKYHGFLRNDKKLFIFLEYCSGGSLRNLYKSAGPLKEEQVVRYMRQVLEGLVYLHEQGVVHRDVKAANILLTSKGDIKLTDFGVSTKVTNKTIKTYSIAGTPNWMAPEIISMDGTSTASDIWSLGATIVELLAGEPLYAHLNEMAALHAIVTDEHPPIPQYISQQCRDFLLKCFEKQPQNRVTANELADHPWLLTRAERMTSSPLDSMIVRHKKSKSESSHIDDDFNSIKRHNTKKFLPMEVTTFKHTDIEIDELIDNELVDEFGELDIKKVDSNHAARAFDPISPKYSKWDDAKDLLIEDPYDARLVQDAIAVLRFYRDEAIKSCDVVFLSQVMDWIQNAGELESDSVRALMDLLSEMLRSSEKLATSFVDLGGLSFLTSFTGSESDSEIKQKSVNSLSTLLGSQPVHISTLCRSGDLRKVLRLLEEDCKEKRDLVTFVIDIVHRSFRDRVVPRDVLQVVTLGFPNFLDWMAVLLLYFVNHSEGSVVDKIVSIICYCKGSPLLRPKPIFLNSIFKIHEKLVKTQQIRLLKLIKSLDIGDISDGAKIMKFLIKTIKRESQAKQVDNELLSISCSMLLNVCHLNKERQVELVSSDALPTFQKLMNTTLPCTEFIIPLLCGLSFNDQLTSKIMKPETRILENYLELLIDPVWQANSMDSLVTLHDRVGGEKIPRLLMTNDCQFLTHGLFLENTLNYGLFLGRLTKFLGLHSKSMTINQIRLSLFNNEQVLDAIFHNITKYKSELVIRVNLFKLLKTLSMNNFCYENYGKIACFARGFKKTNVLLIDQLVNEIVGAENNKENSMMRPPSFVLSHTMA